MYSGHEYKKTLGHFHINISKIVIVTSMKVLNIKLSSKHFTLGSLSRTQTPQDLHAALS